MYNYCKISNMADLKHIGILLLTICPAVLAGDYCFTPTLEYCDWGCCGDDDIYSDNTYCCEDSSVGVIVGIVLGCLGLLAIIVGVVVAICCCMRKSQGRQGVVYGNNTGAAMTTTTTNMAYGVPNTQTVMYGAPGAAGYPMGAAPIQTSYMAPGVGVNMPPQQTAQKWQEPPPTYDTVNPN